MTLRERFDGREAASAIFYVFKKAAIFRFFENPLSASEGSREGVSFTLGWARGVFGTLEPRTPILFKTAVLRSTKPLWEVPRFIGGQVLASKA